MIGTKRLFILAAPSGAGKTTIAKHLLAKFPQLSFSTSATTRSRRPTEQHGRDYYFLTREDFEQRIADDDLVEYEEIYGNYYGTLHSEIRNALDAGRYLIFDVDVKGALSLAGAFPEESLLVFIAPPSLEELEHRLQTRNTETPEQRRTRLERVSMEMGYRDRFHEVIVNDDLQTAEREAEELVRRYVPVG